MKTLISLLLLTILSFENMSAQEKRLMLFSNYTQGTVLMKNKAKIKTELNLDISNNNMMYKQDGKEMILTNMNQIDSIYVNDRKFIIIDQAYLEVVPTKQGNIYVHWDLKNVYKGKKGAFGMTTQAKVESINTAEWQYGVYENQHVDVYKTDNRNKYFFQSRNDGKYISVSNEKTLLKNFPAHKEKIKTYISKQKIDFAKTNEVIGLLEYCLGL